MRSTRSFSAITICSEFWFLDGNIVIIAGTAAFKVHRGQLGRHSEIFDGLFGIPQPADQELFDGCPWVELSDSPSDWFYFLGALYDGLYFKSPRGNDFLALASVLRLSSKYFVDHLRQRCIQRLELDWPSTLKGFDQREKEVTDERGHYAPREFCAHPILVIELAQELNLPEFLPAAFYDLSRYGPSKIVVGTMAPLPAFPVSTAAALPVAATNLSMDLLFLTLRGRERAQQFMAEFVLNTVSHRPASAACSNQHDAHPSQPCHESLYYIALNLLRSVGGIACGRDADPLFTLVQATDMLSRTDFSDGDSNCGLKICASCKLEFADVCHQARKHVWKTLPLWFGLQQAVEEDVSVI